MTAKIEKNSKMVIARGRDVSATLEQLRLALHDVVDLLRKDTCEIVCVASRHEAMHQAVGNNHADGWTARARYRDELKHYLEKTRANYPVGDTANDMTRALRIVDMWWDQE